eukprot:2448576-Pyramimonas_sp.AAC.1
MLGHFSSPGLDEARSCLVMRAGALPTKGVSRARSRPDFEDVSNGPLVLRGGGVYGAVWSSLATSLGFWGCLGPIQGLPWLARVTVHLSPGARVGRDRYGRPGQPHRRSPGGAGEGLPSKEL